MITDYTNFIVIDDDPVNNRICKIIIERIHPDKTIMSFTEPEEGLSYIADVFSTEPTGKAILLLDINMPVLSGWDVLDRFERFKEELQGKITVYILSSSVDAFDKKRAEGNRFVAGYIEKPLTIERVKQFFASN